MALKWVSCSLVFLFLAAAPAVAQSPASFGSPQARSETVSRGISHFDRAFAELTPSHRDAEATREFDAAVAAFEAELKTNPHSFESHWYLGRVFTVRKAFRQAAEHFDEARLLNPNDVDACVYAAAAWADAGRFAEARARLMEAKGRTEDPKALALIDRYLLKIEGRGPVPLS